MEQCSAVTIVGIVTDKQELIVAGICKHVHVATAENHAGKHIIHALFRVAAYALL